MTRDEIIAHARECLSERRRLEAALKKGEPMLSFRRSQEIKALIQRLKTREHELYQQAGQLRRQERFEVGRIHLHLKRVIARELGSETLRGLLEKAMESIAVEEAMTEAGIEPFEEPAA